MHDCTKHLNTLGQFQLLFLMLVLLQRVDLKY